MAKSKKAKPAPAGGAKARTGKAPVARAPGGKPASGKSAAGNTKAGTPKAAIPETRGTTPQPSQPARQDSNTNQERPAMPTLLFYNKPVVLSRETHRNLKLRPVPSFQYAAQTNSVPLSGTEFAAAARQFPILFINDANQQPLPIALLGLRKDENLFVDADGRWSGNYIPAFIRRYPYVLGDKGLPDDFNVCIDEDFAGFNTEEGDPLFNEDGSESDTLKRAMDFLNAYQTDAKRTQAFGQELKRLELLVPQMITVAPKNAAKFNLDGFSVVDENKLTKLSDTDAGNLLRNGHLGWIYAHLLSTHNITELSRRLDPRLASAAA
jgi:hypothetical protein